MNKYSGRIIVETGKNDGKLKLLPLSIKMLNDRIDRLNTVDF